MGEVQRVVVVVLCFLFFFQAEGGIRDLVRSRGLGDVYKRQKPGRENLAHYGRQAGAVVEIAYPTDASRYCGVGAVSYTHLTLPTSDLV